eukprot:TRINITY_DN9238_c0_g1_i1.p1 TRINITY_DN9238_c0_g1~~TRINITY_DN9238_c0_g1_i1.p1  ORF type:complete len:275 (+),score=30.50 TRINITY_DN9238_c0_g1_i1:25-825(+)
MKNMKDIPLEDKVSNKGDDEETSTITAFAIILLILAIISELYSATSIIIIPYYVGSPPNVNCTLIHSNECVKTFYKNNDNNAIAVPYRERWVNYFLIHCATAAVRVIISLTVIIYFGYEKIAISFFTIDEFSLSAFSSVITYAFWVYEQFDNLHIQDKKALEVWSMVLFAMMLFLQQAHIRTVARLFSWDILSLGIYMTVRVYSLLFYITISTIASLLNLNNTSVYIFSNLYYLWAAFSCVNEFWRYDFSLGPKWKSLMWYDPNDE